MFACLSVSCAVVGANCSRSKHAPATPGAIVGLIIIQFHVIVIRIAAMKQLWGEHLLVAVAAEQSCQRCSKHRGMHRPLQSAPGRHFKTACVDPV